MADTGPRHGYNVCLHCRHERIPYAESSIRVNQQGGQRLRHHECEAWPDASTRAHEIECYTLWLPCKGSRLTTPNQLACMPSGGICSIQ